MGLNSHHYSSCYSNSEFGPAHLAHGLLQSSPLGLDVPVEYQTKLNTMIYSLGHVPNV